jgi:hypothetical protein
VILISCRHALRRLLLTAVAVALVIHAPPASAAPKYATGYYAQAGAGATFFLGDGGTYIVPGPGFTLHTGYEPFSWLGLGVRAGLSMHEANVPPPPEQEYFQVWSGAAVGRLQTRIWRIGLWAEGGLGVDYVNTNVLDKVGLTERDNYVGFLLTGGGGVDYHTQNRHFSFGLSANVDATTFPHDAMATTPAPSGLLGVTVQLYFRYAK